jgi:ABC-type uncharacterized transport system ATPase subunit
MQGTSSKTASVASNIVHPQAIQQTRGARMELLDTRELLRQVMRVLDACHISRSQSRNEITVLSGGVE